MAAKYYLNRLTNEAETLPNPTDFAVMRMLQRGFVEVSVDEWQKYVDSHFND